MVTARIEQHPTDAAAVVLVLIVGGRRTTHEVRDPLFVEAVTAAGKVADAVLASVELES